jgi:dipeptide/tripeptide permease
MGPLGYPQAQATSLNATFSVLCYFTPLLGGWLADAKWGRFKTIVVLTLCYIVGVFLSAIAAHPALYNAPMYFIGTMGLVALGSGGMSTVYILWLVVLMEAI